jgi:serine/threonine protein kinase
LRQERQIPAPPEIIAGAFAYMSPEQTGRMNRLMDTCSDLYSLRVALYQMLTAAALSPTLGAFHFYAEQSTVARCGFP